MTAIVDIPQQLLPTHRTVEQTLERIRDRFDQQLQSELPPVQRLCTHVERYRGKMIRPALVALCGMATPDGPDEPSDGHIVVGTVCEMVHMATLVHDDVLDEAETRRGGRSVNELSGNETAVILGDYLFSAAYHLCSTLPTSRASLLIAQTGMTLCTGELTQLSRQGDYSIDEGTYFEIVERKTASLIATACRLGAEQSGADDDTAGRFETFGRKLGVAFQIQDDLLDLLGNQRIVGKPVGRDLELGKLTLPLIHHLRTADSRQRGETLRLLDGDPSIDASLLDMLSATHSVEHARESARGLVNDALGAIAPLPDSPAKRYLEMMGTAVVDRSY